MPLNQEVRWTVLYFTYSLAFFLVNPHSFLYKLFSGEGMRGLTGSDAVLRTQIESQIHEGTISLRFLGIILRVLRPEVSEWIGKGKGYSSGIRFSSYLLYSVQ